MTEKKTAKLDRLRQKIDQADRKIIDLLVKRFEYANEIGNTKKEDGVPVKDPQREKAVLNGVRALAKEPLTKIAAERIYRVILEESRGIQSKKRG